MNRLFPSGTPKARTARPLLLFVFAATLALPKFSSTTPLRPEVSAGAAASHSSATGANAGSAAMQVQIEPETGALVPVTGVAATRVGPLTAPSHSVQGLEVRLRPNGGRSVNLEGRFMESYVATTDASGGTHLDCLPEGEAERFIHEHPLPAPVGPVER